jgi:hypothetical protein
VIDNIFINGEALGETRYLSLWKFTRTIGGGDVVNLTDLARGKVYHIPEVKFTETDLEEEPYYEGLELEIEIGIGDWEKEDIGWEW